MASLGLKPLSKSAERKIRNRLGFALSKWEEPYTATEVKDVVGSLKAHAKRLDQISSIGTITRVGFARAHDLAVSGQVVQILASDPNIGSAATAHAYLSDFCGRAETLASACRVAMSALQSNRGKSGKNRYDWYDEFTATLVEICKQNKIERAQRLQQSRPLLLRASNFTVPTTPTLRPKLRKVARRSFSIAMAFDCISLRWVSSIRCF
jgi:hypothetical protein